VASWHACCIATYVRRHLPPRTLRVLLVHDSPQRGAVGTALDGAEGVALAHTLDSPLELLASIERHQPDVVLIDTESPSRDVLEQLAAMSASAPRPVVMLTDDGHDEAIRAALGVGVSAYVVDGVESRRLGPIIRVAVERFQAEQRLREELEATRTQLAERKLVERAKGILMKQRGCEEQEAFAALRSLAMQRGIRLGEAARQVIDVAGLLG
jgi:response regulator NasT